jgi:hypothetical protein
MSPEVINLLTELNIFFYIYPPNCSHVLQVLDQWNQKFHYDVAEELHRMELKFGTITVIVKLAAIQRAFSHVKSHCRDPGGLETHRRHSAVHWR